MKLSFKSLILSLSIIICINGHYINSMEVEENNKNELRDRITNVMQFFSDKLESIDDDSVETKDIVEKLSSLQ